MAANQIILNVDQSFNVGMYVYDAAPQIQTACTSAVDNGIQFGAVELELGPDGALRVSFLSGSGEPVYITDVTDADGDGVADQQIDTYYAGAVLQGFTNLAAIMPPGMWELTLG